MAGDDRSSLAGTEVQNNGGPGDTAMPEDDIDSGLPAWKTWSLIGLLGTAGAVGGLALMWLGSGGSADARAYQQLPEARLHIGLIAGQVAFWCIAAGLLLFWRHELGTTWKIRSTIHQILASSIALGLLIYVPLTLSLSGGSGSPLTGYHYRIIAVYWLGLIVVIPALLTLYSIDEGCRDDYPGRKTTGYVEEYFVMRALLRRVLVIMGVVISLIVVATGAYFNALRAYRDADHPKVKVPSQASLLAYGALFVAVLVAMFLPVFVGVRQRGDRIVDDDIQLVAPGNAALSDNLDKRLELRKYLGLEDNLRDQFERSVLVLSPLLTAALSTFLGK